MSTSRVAHDPSAREDAGTSPFAESAKGRKGR